MKKLMLFLVCLIPFVLIFTVQISTNYVEKTKYVAVEKVVFEDKEDNVNIEKISSENVVLNFKASIFPLSATNRVIVYSSSDETIASVDENGVITFLDFGTVTITATSAASEKIKDSCTFFVTDTKVHRIEILENPEVLKMGESANIRHRVIPNEALNKTITYSTSNSNIATVTPTGKVTAVGKGVATITLTSANNISNSFDVEVIVPVTSIKVDDNTKHFVTGNSEFNLSKINVSVYPANANNQDIVFVSQDTNMAEIVNNQKVILKNRGTATIIVKSVDGNKTDTFTIEYTGGYFISASIKDTSKNIYILYENSYQVSIDYDLYPLDANPNNISFTSSNINVAIVDSDGLVTICGGGDAVITMTVQTGGTPIILTSNIHVSRNVENIIANDVEITDSTYQIPYQIIPADYTSEVAFSVGSDIATITNTGLLSFKKQGAVSVTISTSCGKSKTIVIKWEKPDAINEHITSNNQKLTVNYLYSFGLVFDSSLEMGIVSYSLYDTDILEYDVETEEFTAILGGTTTIVATYKQKQISIIVQVIRKAEEIAISSSDITLQSNTCVTAKKRIQLIGSVLPIDATNQSIAYTSSDTSIASVENGLVVFGKKGTVIISASVDDVTQNITITSTFGNPSGFELVESSHTLPDIGETYTILIGDNLYPTDVIKSNLVVSYYSLNSNIATVSNDGVVTAVGVGNTKIVVTIGDVTQEFSVTVLAKTKSVKITYQGSELSSGKIIGNQIQLSTDIYPTFASIKDVEWQVIEGDVARINNSGLLTFTGFGSVKVMVNTVDSNANSTVVITRIKGMSNIEIYDESESMIASSNSEDRKTIIKTPDDTADIVLRVELKEDGLLDPENINFDDVIASVVLADDNLTLQITRTQAKNYFSISRGEINQKQTATISFAYIEKTVNVDIEYRHLKSLSLALKNKDDVNFGLERKRVFATQTYDATLDTKLTNKFVIEYTRVPANNIDTLYWYTDSPYAVINDGVLEVNSNSITAETLILVKVWADNVDPVQYIFTFVSGCINVSTTEGLDWAIGQSKNVVLQASLGTEEDNIGNYAPLTDLANKYSDSVIYLPSQIYGNGYTLNFESMKKDKFNFKFTNARNITIKGQDFNEDKNYLNIICVSGKFEYARIQQMKKIWTGIGENTEAVLRNCIIKHAGQCGLQIGSDTKGKVYLENTIFADVAQAAVDYQGGSLYIKGFFDVYNFCTPGVFDNLGSLVIKNAYKEDAFAEYVYKPVGKENDKNVSEWKANIAIAMIPSSGVGSPDVSDVYFWNGEEYALLGDGVESETGMGYKRLYYKGTLTKAYMVLSPLEGSPIQPDDVLDSDGESKVYRVID